MVKKDKSISCIIINTFCDFFVKKRVLPSIIRTTKHLVDWEIEIIIVDNSEDKDLKKKWTLPEHTNIKVIHSQPHHLPKAFNTGVKESQNHYIAIFHDDCEIIENNWVEMMTKPLNNDVYATGSEMHYFSDDNRLSYLKEVPLVMERNKFIEIGGYDEKYYWGFEDAEFSEKIIKKYNKNIKEIPVEYIHFNGMSTLLLQTKHDNNISVKEYNKMKRDFSSMKNKKEFNNYIKEKLKKTKVNIIKLKIPLLLKLVMIMFSKSINIKTIKNIGINLGYLQALEYWGNRISLPKLFYRKLPRKVAFEMFPQTKEDMDLLIKDIKLDKRGELYSKLEKYKGKIFRDHFGN